MATEFPQELAHAFELALQALERATAFAAAGGPVPRELLEQAEKLVGAGVTLIAVATGATPRDVADRIFVVAMSDDQWRERLCAIRQGNTPPA